MFTTTINKRVRITGRTKIRKITTRKKNNPIAKDNQIQKSLVTIKILRRMKNPIAHLQDEKVDKVHKDLLVLKAKMEKDLLVMFIIGDASMVRIVKKVNIQVGDGIIKVEKTNKGLHYCMDAVIEKTLAGDV